MPRFSSLSHAPAETRRIFRDRFRRFLPVYNSHALIAKDAVTLSDEQLLQLLLHLDIQHQNEMSRACAVYDAALGANSTEPPFDALIERGWYRKIWDRVSMSMELGRSAREYAKTAPAFDALLKRRFETSYKINRPNKLDDRTSRLGKEVADGAKKPTDITSLSPEWVSARLWDRSEQTDLKAKLRFWLDRWQIVQAPRLVPAHAWLGKHAEAFRAEAISAICSCSDLSDWDATRTLILKQIVLARGDSSISDYDGFIPKIPESLFDKVIWLENHQVERELTGALWQIEDAAGLVRVLFADVEESEHGAAPNGMAIKILEAAISRPELLQFVIFHLYRNPVLLADVLLYPPTSILACYLIAKWNGHVGAWDVEVQTRDNLQSKLCAFTDAASILGEYISQGLIAAPEVAALLNWLHKMAPSSFGGKSPHIPPQLDVLRDVLRSQSVEYLKALYSILMGAAPNDGLGSSLFSAALDVIDIGNLASVVDPDKCVSAYVSSVRAGEYSLSARGITGSEATALYEMSCRSSGSLTRDFLYPIEVKARLAEAKLPGKNPISVSDSIARSLRAHIRILSRAISSLDDPPESLADALIEAIHAGVIAHEEKNTVAAFAARYELSPFSIHTDRPITADVGRALTKSTGKTREKLLRAILESDEPAFLAKLLVYAPPDSKQRIKERIANLPPDRAADIMMLTEAQARVDALLLVGLPESAEKFIDAESALKPLGETPARKFYQFQNRLRLLFAKQDWKAIESVALPDFQNSQLKSQAAETVEFFKGIAELSKADGNRAQATYIFQTLNRQHPYVASYAVNFFAAKLSALLSGNIFSVLRGEKAQEGERLLRESKEAMDKARGATEQDKQIFACNMSLLSLALGKPQEAIDILAISIGTDLEARKAAYTSVALARLGRGQEANTLLARAKAELGEDEILVAAGEHLKTGSAYNAPLGLSTNNDPVLRIKAALHELRNLNPDQQAAVFDTSAEPFDEFVIGQVRLATASVVELVPQMKGVNSEDDLSAVIRELLTARLTHLGWSVPDQPKGGFSPKGNPGERDLLLKRDSSTLAVIEAVVKRQGGANITLTEHFQKLLGYGTCRLFFHLTYAYVDDTAPVIAHLKAAAKDHAPDGFKYLETKDIAVTDSRPHGFAATYETSTAQIKVVFLVLDLLQQKQRNASKTAKSA